MLRFVLGADRLPELSFSGPDAPSWVPDEALHLAQTGDAFELLDAGSRVLGGSACVQPFNAAFVVGDCPLFGFGAATGDPVRNDARFRVMTRDTLVFGIAGASYTAFPFFIAWHATGSLGILVATTEPLDVVIGNGRVAMTAVTATVDAPVDVIVETLHGTLALEMYPPQPAATGWGSLFLDDGESESSARFVLDVTSCAVDGLLHIGLERAEDSFAPSQSELELRLPACYRSLTVDGEQMALRPVDLATEGRRGSLVSARVPLQTRSIVAGA